MKRLDAETWAEIRVAYETTRESVRSIAARYGTSESTMYTRIVREAWALRSNGQRVVAEPPPQPRARAVRQTDRAGTAVADGELGRSEETGGTRELPAPAAPAAPREPDTPVKRAQRLLRLIDLQLDSMERYMNGAGPETAQDHERNARAFSTLVGELDNVMSTVAAIDKGPEGASASDDDKKRETERLRREVAERLERLNQQWLAQSKSE